MLYLFLALPMRVTCSDTPVFLNLLTLSILMKVRNYEVPPLCKETGADEKLNDK
jgi:hypothetical protein